MKLTSKMKMVSPANIALVIFILIHCCGMAQIWKGSTVSTTTEDYNTSIQLMQLGWGANHGILFNAYVSPSLSQGPFFTTGNTKHRFEAGPFSSGAGAISYLANGGRMDFLISGPSTGADQNIDWGGPKMTINRNGFVGIGAEDPFSTLEVRRSPVSIGQTVDVAHFTFKGENHFEQPGVFTEGKIVLGSKAYGNGILRRAEIGFSTSGTWRGGILKFYTTPDDDTWTPLVRMIINQSGNVGIGTSSPTSKLTVAGDINSREIKVTVNAGSGPDYVFDPTYTLPSLDSVQSYINQNKHLPEVPSAKEMEANGVNLGEMNILLLKKVEELTLYLIIQQKQIEELKTEIKKE